MALSLPRTDDALLGWGLNFSTKITATPTTYGLVAAQATAYNAVYQIYASALAACDKGERTTSSTMAKKVAGKALRLASNQTVSLINGTPSVTDAMRLSLGMNVRAMPTPIPAPSSAPALVVVSVSGWAVRIKMTDAATSGKRGKPPGVIGASVFSFVGAVPPTDMSGWTFEGNVGKTTLDVVFDSSNAPGTKVYLTAFWFNGRKQSGPACAPVSTNLQGGLVAQAA